MDVIKDLQAVLINALLREVTPDQAGRALDELARVIEGPAFTMTSSEDEVAASWLSAMIPRLLQSHRA